MRNPTLKQGHLLTVPLSDEGDQPRLVTEGNGLPVASMGEQVARGNIPGASPYGSYGQRTASAGENNRVIWPNGAFSLPAAAGVQMSIVSTSADDDLTGIGARTLELHYLDDNLDQQTELINTDGLTPVLTIATNIRFINDFHVHVYGTSPVALGTITASNGGITYGQMTAGDNRSTSSARMIPRAKVCYVGGAIGGAVSGTAAASVIVKLVASELDAYQYTEPFNLYPYGSIGAQDTTVTFNFPVPIKFKAGTVVALTGSTDKIAIISGSWFGWIEDA
jgi:hypothetical protein